MHRFVGCGIFLGLVFSIVYVVSEIWRFSLGLPFRWPGTGMHYSTKPAINYPLLWVSIGVTHWLCATSIGKFEKRRYATYLYLLMMVFTLITSLALTMLMEFIVKDSIISNGNCLFRVYFGGDPLCKGAGPLNSLGDRIHVFFLPFPSYVLGGASGLLYYVTHPNHAFAPLYNSILALSVDDKEFVNAYSMAVSYSVVVLRVLVTGLFVVGWSIARSGHKVLSFLVYRFSESEKGPFDRYCCGDSSSDQTTRRIT